jgi:hypothetical protein
MTTTKLSATTLAAAALLVVSLGTATFEISRAHNTTAALLSARAEDSALAARLRALDGQATAAERDAATLAQQLRDAESAAAESARRAALASAAAAKAAAQNPAAEGTAFMQRHPAVRQALVDWFDAQTNYSYSAFYEQAGLTKEQIAQFQALHRFGSFGRGLGPTTPYLQFQLNSLDSWREAEDEMRVLLGPGTYQKYQAFQATIPAREMGAQLASALAFTPSPLTSPQFEEFTSALCASHAMKMTPTGPEYDWTVITQNAAGTLTPEQQSVLAGIRAKSEFDAEYSHAAQPSSPAPNKP